MPNLELALSHLVSQLGKRWPTLRISRCFPQISLIHILALHSLSYPFVQCTLVDNLEVLGAVQDSEKDTYG